MAMELMDLDVSLDDTVFVKLADDEITECSPFFLTNIDQMLAFTVETLYFYAAGSTKGSSDTVAATLESALRRLLPHYDFLAGRVALNERTQRMEITRNNAGVQVTRASCALAMAALGDVATPNPLFRKFLPKPVRAAATVGDIPLLMVQVTTLACGGHVIGFGMSHLLWDGHGVVEFLMNLTSLARGGEMVFHPKPDRSMLAARDPPTPVFDHPEYLKLDELPPPPTSFTTATAATSEFVELAASTKHVTKMVAFSAADLAALKRRASSEDSAKVSTFEALAAHVWQARIRAIDAPPTALAQLLYAVDIRDRVAPPLPRGFMGNAIYSACARATCAEVREGTLAFCVREVQAANERVTDEYVRSGIDWCQVYRGVPALPSGIYISSWQKMPFYHIDFGWGPPVFAGPAVTPMVEFVVFLPTPHQDGSLNVILCLEPHVMAKFEEYAKVSAEKQQVSVEDLQVPV